MKGKILVLLVSMALLVGFLSGCIEEETTEEETTPTANNVPIAKFTSSVDHDVTMAGGNVTFDGSESSDADDGTVLAYAWDFGDGTTETGIIVTHTYTENKTYTVKLTVNDSKAEDTYTNEKITVGNVAPTASFTYEITDLNVTFTDTSEDDNGDAIVAWAWDFDDDTSTAEDTTQNPTYPFAEAGIYVVTLTVTEDTIYALEGTYTDTIEIIVS